MHAGQLCFDLICLLCQGVFTLKGLFSLSVFMRVVHHATCFHLHSFPDFPLTQLTAAIIWQHLLRLWPSEPLSAPSPTIFHLRSEIRLPFLRYNTLFMSFQMLCGRQTSHVAASTGLVLINPEKRIGCQSYQPH